PWHVRTLLVREPGDLWIGHGPVGVGWSVAGRGGAGARDVPATGVQPRASSNEADEQSRATGGGAGGAKAGDQGERGTAKHTPDTGPGTCDPGARPRTASFDVRHPR